MKRETVGLELKVKAWANKVQPDDKLVAGWLW